MSKLNLLLGLSLFASASAASQSMEGAPVFEQPYWTERPVIEALGRASLELSPNRGQFSVHFVETNRDSKVAMQAAVERARAAYSAIKSVAGENSEVTTSVLVEPYYEQYRDRDGDRIENRRADKVKGYEAQVSVQVLVKDVALAGTTRAAALALGPERADPLRLYLERTADVLQQSYEAAVRDGAARARISAAAAGATLGDLLVVQEGNGPCLGRWTSSAGRVIADRMRNAPAAERLDSVSVTSSKRGASAADGIVVSQAEIDALNLPSDRPKQTVEAQVCMIYDVGE
ncbi:MAG: SIMPL domain-containing protein [Pseudomonadota bacterium]